MRTECLFQERRPLTCPARPMHPPRRKATPWRFWNGLSDELHPHAFQDLPITRNGWPRMLGFLGLLPGGLRKRLKALNGGPRPDDVSETLFWAGYRVWKARRNLLRELLESFPIYRVNKCKNPFHYLPRFANLSDGKRGECACYNNFVARTKNLDIRAFLDLKKSRRKANTRRAKGGSECRIVSSVLTAKIEDTSGFDRKYGCPLLDIRPQSPQPRGRARPSLGQLPYDTG